MLPFAGDIRDDDRVTEAVAATVERFGGIDAVVNNASAINLASIGDLPAKRYDLMLDVNARGTFLLTSLALPHLLESPDPHVLTLSPPLDPDRRWLRDHAPLHGQQVRHDDAHPRRGGALPGPGCGRELPVAETTIATAAVQNIVGGEAALAVSRRPEIMADAAHQVLSRPATERTGQTLIDEDVLRAAGVTDFARYRYDGATEEQLQSDIFLS